MKTLTLIFVLAVSNCFAEINFPKNVVAKNVETIYTYFNKASYFHLKTHHLSGMLNEYIWDSYEVEDMNANLKIIFNHDKIETDANIVGTLKDGIAENEITLALSKQNTNASPLAIQKVYEALDTLKHEGVIFGFDGNHPYGCFALSQFILIIDTKNSDIYGLDLY